ncbi:hypothetical protein Y1Q_0016280 [Alligator mississippiensis]|uniref:Reverse transcriptase domain-containing protein n=1 Tax=Alligator mississippiensis TaxID=8496 RepID=A0A151M453_ALLMI|nr:hypothetical protein Y1Q_0016280 [Alligator mississippiensis]
MPTPWQTLWLEELSRANTFETFEASVARLTEELSAATWPGQPRGNNNRLATQWDHRLQPQRQPRHQRYDPAAASRIQKLYRANRPKAVREILEGPLAFCQVPQEALFNYFSRVFNPPSRSCHPTPCDCQNADPRPPGGGVRGSLHTAGSGSPSEEDQGHRPWQGWDQMVLDNTRRMRKQCAVVWLDISNAFSSMPHRHIFGTLSKLGQPDSVIDLVRELYHGCTTTVHTTDGKTTEILIQSGKLSVLAYANDLVLLTPNTTQLHQMLDVMSEAARWMGLHFNGQDL